MTDGGLATASAMCPYQGLAPYEERNSELFFGRARAIRDLLERLGRRTGSVLMVSGASGVGKSSLLRAGVLPALADGGLPGSDRWTRTVVTPGALPLRALTQSRAAADAGRQILVVDQFEELFTLTGDEHVRQECVQLLHEAAADGVAVLIGVRADYWERCAAYPQFAEAIMDGQFIVEPMTGDDMRLAITGPAAAAGLEVEPGLVDTILGELRADATGRYEPGALPLLSQALRNTWERREGRLLTVRGYEESGRVDGAVRHTTDAVFGALSRDDRTTALRAFRRMAVIASGARIARRPATRAEIHAATAAGTPEKRAKVDAMLSAFADRRLLTLDADGVQIAHDTLLTSWPALRQWIEPDVEALGVYDRLIADATEWNANHRDHAYLYRGGRLLAVDDSRPRWERDPGSFPPPGPVVEAFVAASQAAAKRAGRTRRLVSGGLALLTVLAVGGAGLAVNAAADARDQRTLAVSRQLAAQSEVTGDPVMAGLLAVAAWRINPTEEARHRLLDATARPARAALTGHTSVINALDVSGSIAATASSDGTVRLWDARSRRRLGPPITHPGDCAKSAGMTSTAFVPSGKTIATACGTTVRFWDVASRGQTGSPMETEAATDAMAFAPDGRTLVTGDRDGAVRLWDVSARKAETLGRIGARPTEQRGGRSVKRLVGSSNPRITDVAFSPDGKHVASAGDDNTVRVWDVAGREQVSALDAHGDLVNDIAFSPDGTSLATAGKDGTVRLWSLTEEKETAKLEDPGGLAVAGVAFSPDGTRIATSGTDGALRLWDVASGEQAGAALLDQAKGFVHVAFSRDGRQLIANDIDRRILVFDPLVLRQIGAPRPGKKLISLPTGGLVLPGGKRIRLPGGNGPPISFTVASPDGRTLVSTRGQDTLKLWSARPRRQIGELTGHTGRVSAAVFSPDGRTLATGSADATIRLWDVRTQRPIGEPFIGHTDGITRLWYAKDGGTLTSMANDKTIRRWNVALPADPAAAVCANAGRSLTQEEWARYLPGEDYQRICG